MIAFLLWLWLTNLALLFGAELDAELERGRELQSGIAAEETIQLPAARHPQDRQGREEAARGGPPGPGAAGAPPPRAIGPTTRRPDAPPTARRTTPQRDLPDSRLVGPPRDYGVRDAGR